MKEQVIVLAESDRESLGHVRTITGLQVGLQIGKIWLRGILVDDGEIDLRIRQLPAMQRFFCEDGMLFLPEALTPVAHLPKLNWQSLQAHMPLDLPTAAYAGESAQRIPVRLVPATQEQPVVALRCALEHLQAWADTAAEVRISRLRMAINSESDVLVMGHPLPNVPGTSYWSCDGLLLPAGMQLEFPLLAPVILSKVNPDKESIVMLDREGQPERIHLGLFVNATRSGIRLSPYNPQTDDSESTN
ncbi:MAG: hypothetical protein U0176_22320 [Bacteroidia bacterium]